MRVRDILGFAIIMIVLCWVVVTFAATPKPVIAPTQTTPTLTQAVQDTSVPKGYAVRQSIKLDRATYGIDGSLEVLEDARITPELQKAMWRVSADPRQVLADNDPHRTTFEKDSLRDAKVRIVTRDGRLAFEDKFVWPLAEVEVTPLTNAGDPVIFVTTDNTTNFGSYKGTATRLLEFKRDAKDAAPSYASIGEDPKPALLIRSKKSDWRLTKDARGTSVIQLVKVYPDVNGNIRDFIIEYATVRSDEGGWIMISRTEQGIWEPQEAWPAAAKFP